MDAKRFNLPLLLALPGFVALLAEPLLWLVGTWLNSFYGSSGILVAAGCLGLLLRSACSGPAAPDPFAAPAAVRLMLGAAALRLAGRLLAVNLVGALALCLDLWALGLVLRLRGRPWAVQPALLAALFAFSLPAERLLQRLLGHPLRLVSTVAAESVLALGLSGVQRAGTVLSRNAVVLDIDLPCSGARGLLLLCTLGLAIACRRQLGLRRAAAAALAVPAGALVANTTRIVLLFVGTVAGLPALAEPWHGILGLVGLALGAAPLLFLAGRWQALAPRKALFLPSPEGRGPASAWSAAVFSCVALAVALAPGHPVDVSRKAFSRALPANLGSWPGQAVALSAQERGYFGTFGGSAQKRVYHVPGGGTRSVLLVTSSAPLRHLHEPEECLSFSGYALERAGAVPGLVPTVAWKATSVDGVPWRVEVSYVSESGQGAALLSEVVWRWLAQPAIAWSLVERVSPWSACETDPRLCREFDRTLFAALDLRFEEVSR